MTKKPEKSTKKSKFVSGFDSYNLCLTGDIGRTLATPSSGLNEHIPVIVQKEVQMDDRVIGVDAYNFNITWGIACTLNATSCDSPSHSGPTLLILNDQGGSVMNISHDVISTLRAESHQHEPVICFEPGIAKREGNQSRFVNNVSGTLRAEMGDNQPAVCYEVKDEQCKVPESMGHTEQTCL